MITKKKSRYTLPIPWEQLQGVVWMLGIAILAWQGWWWPGILVLVAISALVQGYAEIMQRREKEALKAAKLEKDQVVSLPDICSNCGSPVDSAKVKWTTPTSATCSFCGSALKTSTRAP